MKGPDIAEADLHAFLDGELDEAQARVVRAHLDGNPADANRIETWRRQNAAIRRAFDTPREAAPRAASRATDDALSAASAEPMRLDHIRAARRRRRAVATLAAFLGGGCVALLGAVAIERIGAAPDVDHSGEAALLSPAGQARRARIAWRTYVRELERTSERAVIDRAAAASTLARTAALPRIPDLSSERYELIATRTMPGEQEPAAFLLYQSSALVRVALLVERTPESDHAPLLSDDGGLRCLAWRAAGYSFVLVGPAESDTLRGIGRAVATNFAGR